MKYFKRLNIYKASNVTYNPETKQAHSYNWWCFLKIIKGKLVFNNYRYSPSTGKHQRKVRDLLDKLNIKIDIMVDNCHSLNDERFGRSVIPSIYYKIYTLEHELITAKHKESRLSEIKALKEKIEVLRGLGFKCSNKEKSRMKRMAIESREINLKRKREKRQRDKENSESFSQQKAVEFHLIKNDNQNSEAV